MGSANNELVYCCQTRGMRTAASKRIVGIALIPPLMFCNSNQSRRCPFSASPLVVVNSFCLAPISQNHIYTSQNAAL